MNEPQKIVLEVKLVENTPANATAPIIQQEVKNACCGNAAAQKEKLLAPAFESGGGIIIVRPFCKYEKTQGIWWVKTRIVGFAPKDPLTGLFPNRVSLRIFDNIVNIKDDPESCTSAPYNLTPIGNFLSTTDGYFVVQDGKSEAKCKPNASPFVAVTKYLVVYFEWYADPAPANPDPNTRLALQSQVYTLNFNCADLPDC